MVVEDLGDVDQSVEGDGLGLHGRGVARRQVKDDEVCLLVVRVLEAGADEPVVLGQREEAVAKQRIETCFAEIG